jgi:hypothetical protein
MVEGLWRCSCVAGGDPGDVELRRVVLRLAGDLLLRRLVQERPVAPRPPVVALAGALGGGGVVVGEEALHASRRVDTAAARRRGVRLRAAHRGRPRHAAGGGGAERRARHHLAAVLLPERLHLLPRQRLVPPRKNYTYIQKSKS